MRHVTAALREQRRAARLQELVAQYEAEFGPIPAEALAEAEAEFEAAEAAWRATAVVDRSRPPNSL
jgi:hypothetical protein